jgi:thioredoxin reductase
MKFESQAKDHGAEIKYESVVDIKKNDPLFHLTTDAKNEYTAKTIIIATVQKEQTDDTWGR